MCGIAGVIGRNAERYEDRVEHMISAMRHRGPDGAATLAIPGASLGFARLAIIDLTDRSMQPMVSSDRRHILTFNGEIYNYRELKLELEADHCFQSDGDSEVLLAAWRKWGEACLDRLDGMFAFAIYDSVERSAFFARDRFGQKPLHLAESEGLLFFSSEVRGLLAGGIAAHPDLAVWSRYLLTASYDDTADTYFAGISQLLPGECARFDQARGLRRYRWYHLADQYRPLDVPMDKAAGMVREIMVDACRIHMRSDVPIGIMLSGGLDSSSMLAAFELGNTLHPGVKCFSIDFGPDFTEKQWIQSAAEHHRLPWQIDSYEAADFAESLRAMVWQLEGPVGGLMNCALVDVMVAARSQDFIVLQDGTGPDEAFGGYRNHHNLYLGLKLRDGSADLSQRLVEYAENWGVDATAARKAAEVELERLGSHTAIDGSAPVRPEMLSPTVRGGRLLQSALIPDTGDPLRDAFLHYIQGSKIPRNTRMLDRLSMGFGIELRLPFLDHRFIELGLNLPADHYFIDGRSKGIIREALKGAMPDDVRLATKRSIQAPQGQWLRREPLATYVRDLINSESFASRGLFDVPACRVLHDRFLAGEFDNSFFVWQWVNVEEWFRIFIDGDAIAHPQPLVSLSRPTKYLPAGLRSRLAPNAMNRTQ